LHFFDVLPPPDMLAVTKRPKDAMAHKICATLAFMQASLRRCQRKGCGRLFIANKRQSYCTPACNGRARTYRYRAKQRHVADSSSSQLER
jgi:predicted RNA-binding Zn ribbon-like protein